MRPGTRSANKQGIDAGAAKVLVDAGDKMSEIFWNSKGVARKDEVAAVRFGS